MVLERTGASAGKMAVGADSSGFSVFDTNSYTRRLTVTSTGSVGIGTSAPQATLDVNGKIKVGVDPTSVASTADTVPESYKFSRSDCSAATRGSMFVGRFSGDANQDGLCVCMDIVGTMEWVCFNP